jgi:hypothetical protein
MKPDRTDLDRLRKVQAVLSDEAATGGEKRAAGEAAARIKERIVRERIAEIEGKPGAPKPGLMYLLGRALGRTRRAVGSDARPNAGLMYNLGRAFRKATKRP